ncbi:MAG: TraI/MobA(P) family conjugative relaxase [Leptolyngbyaceae cyanobacterium bins.59]|nr:TraI/MobA(P) family conjugative relaxase [Leptolyngbyaceae cyanobacterium bins.59]
MIVKKIKNPRKSASKSTRIFRLTDYIRSPEREDSQEKCVYTGSRGFLTQKHHSQKAEMLALAQDAPRSKDPISHFVLSWHEGERPSEVQIEEAVDIFLDQLGWQDHQVIFGLHADTDNLHLHLAINRVHPITLKVINPHRGFDIEDAHRAIARIEHAQGWQREPHGRHQVIDGKVERVQTSEKSRQPAQKQRDVEWRTGEKSAERIAIETAAPILKQVSSWQELHRLLAEQGMRYERVGSGAKIFVGDIAVKASSADRNASLSKMEKRLGAYEPPLEVRPIAERGPEPLQEVPDWDRYIAERKDYQAAKASALLELKRRQEAEAQQLCQEQQQERKEVLALEWQGLGQVRNAVQSVLADEQKEERTALSDRHQEERRQIRSQYPPCLDLEQWQLQQANLEAAKRKKRQAENQVDTLPDVSVISVITAPVDLEELPVASVEAAIALEGESQESSFEQQDAPENLEEVQQSLEDTENSEELPVAAIALEEESQESSSEQQEVQQSLEDAEVQRAIVAYQRHHYSLWKNKDRELTQVDAVVAMRMRITRHSQSNIEKAVRQCAPGRYPDARWPDGYADWDGYAKRTVEYAFSENAASTFYRLRGKRMEFQCLEEGRKGVQKRQSKTDEYSR